MRVALAILAGALALAACGDPDNPPAKYALEGSLSQLMDLGYDEVRVKVAQDDVGLLFVRLHPLTVVGDAGQGPAATTEDYPFQVGLLRWGASLDGGLVADLAETTDAGVHRATFTRDVVNDPRKTFPPCRIGGLVLDATPVSGRTVSGNVHVTFENGIETASGRTVFVKNFTAKVVQ